MDHVRWAKLEEFLDLRRIRHARTNEARLAKLVFGQQIPEPVILLTNVDADHLGAFADQLSNRPSTDAAVRSCDEETLAHSAGSPSHAPSGAGPVRLIRRLACQTRSRWSRIAVSAPMRSRAAIALTIAS